MGKCCLFLIRSFSCFYVMRTSIKVWMSSNFSQVGTIVSWGSFHNIRGCFLFRFSDFQTFKNAIDAWMSSNYCQVSPLARKLSALGLPNCLIHLHN